MRRIAGLIACVMIVCVACGGGAKPLYLRGVTWQQGRDLLTTHTLKFEYDSGQKAWFTDVNVLEAGYDEYDPDLKLNLLQGQTSVTCEPFRVFLSDGRGTVNQLTLWCDQMRADVPLTFLGIGTD